MSDEWKPPRSIQFLRAGTVRVTCQCGHVGDVALDPDYGGLGCTHCHSLLSFRSLRKPRMTRAMMEKIRKVANGLLACLEHADDEDERAQGNEVFEYAQEWMRVDQDQAALRKARQAVRKEREVSDE